MNIRTPLAAALLMAASTASAQFTLTDMGSGAPSASSPFSLANTTGLGAVDDIVFKCSRVIPYRACTSEELTQRERIRASGTCPRPASPACVDYLMAAGEAAPVQLLGNQSNPSTANDEFFKKCGTVPYRLCTPDEEKQKAAWEAGKKEDKSGAESGVNDSIQGPPQMVDMPEGGPQGKMLQYPSGRVEYCFDNSCSKTSGKPMTPKEAEKYLRTEYADQKQLANSINAGGPSPTNAGNTFSGLGMDDDSDNTPSGGVARTNSNTGGSTPPPSSGKPTPNTPNPNPSSGSTDDNTGGGMTTASDNNPRSLGSDIGGDLGRLGGGSGSSYDGGIASSGEGEPIIKVDGTIAAAEAVKGGYTYTKIGAAAKTSESLIKGGAATFQAESDNGRRDVDSTIGDGSNLGKIQAERQ